MGVKGLKSYVESDPRSLRYFKLRNTRVVIDGGCLKYYLHDQFASRTNCSKYGGDYVDFGQHVRRFFECLKACHVEPYVIMDGGMDPSLGKLNELKKRAAKNVARVKNRTSKRFVYSPLLDSKVFRDVMVEMGVETVHSIFEADGDVAHLAKKLQCPVMAEDSDYYVFDLEAGYIPLSQLKYRDNGSDLVNQRDGQGAYLDCKIFYSDDFAHGKQIDREVLPLITLRFGNDFYTPSQRIPAESIFKSFRNQPANQAMDWYLKSFGANRIAAYDRLYKAYQFYQFGWYKKCLCSRYSALQAICTMCDSKQNVPLVDHKLPEDLCDLVINGRLEPTLLNYRTVQIKINRAQSEDLTSQSSYVHSFNLQRYVVTLMSTENSKHQYVTNLDRVGEYYESVRLSCNQVLPNGKVCPKFDDLATMSRNAKKRVFFSILKTDKRIFNSMATKVMKTKLMPKESSLQLISLATILKSARQEANLSEIFCMSVIASSMFHLYVDKSREQGAANIRLFLRKLRNPNANQLKPYLVHPYCEFQAIFLVIRQICSILNYPIADFKPHTCLTGTLIFNLSEILSHDKKPKSFIDDILRHHDPSSLLFSTLYNYVIG